jgi:vancomycin resistance protein YoaR
VQPLVAQANAIATTDVTLAVGTEKLTIDGKTLGSWVDIDGPTAGSYRLTIDTSDLSALVTPFAKELTQPAKNATFEFEGSKVVPVPGTNGKALDVDAATAALDTAIRGIQPGGQPITVEHALTSLEPDYTTAQAIADASKIKRVSAWDTRFPVGPKNFWGKNISTPTTKINGYVVAPGKTFDFWKVVGEVSRRTGYGQGAAIINGRTEPTGALAGGICSCSTTLFNAALRYGLDMGARRNHYYYIDRYPLGLDATVFKSSGGAVTTMSFTNDTPHPILIRGINSPGKVRFELWSQPVGRKVTFSKPIVKNVKVATDERHCTPDLRPGQTARVEYPTNGMQVWVTRTVTEDGKVIHQDTYRSNYGRVNGMILFGKPAGYTGRCTEHLR